MAERSQEIANEVTARTSGIPQDQRILALEVRPQRIGFVVLQGASRLLDWGVRAHTKETCASRSTLSARIAVLLDLYAPAAIVIRRRDGKGTSARRTVAEIVAKLRVEARQRSISCHFVSATEVRRFFARHGEATKHATAALLAEWYPDLAWKLPPKRRPWESERYNTLVFDAAATAVAFLARS